MGGQLPGARVPVRVEKISACIGFLERGGSKAIITSPENLERALDGEAGTQIVP